MAAGRPLTPRQRAEIIRRHAKGETRNSIAKALKLSGSTVSKVVAAKGGSFERGPEIAAATEARKVDLAALRAALAVDLTMDAMKLRAQLWQPHRYWDWGGKDHEFGEITADEPTPADKRALASAVGVVIDRSFKLAPPVDDTGTDAARSMLGALADGIRRLAREDTSEEG